jgi:hypothetical protein
MNYTILGAIIIQSFIARANRKAGAIVGMIITAGILVWGLSVYGQGDYIAFFGIKLSEAVFFLLCLVWFAFDVSGFFGAKKVEQAEKVEDQKVVPTAGKIICASCHQENPANVFYCLSCGEKLDQGSTPNSTISTGS